MNIEELKNVAINDLSIKDQIKMLQEQRIAEILNDTTINKLQKMFLLTDEKLFDYASYIQNEFDALEAKFKSTHTQRCYIFDNLLHDNKEKYARYMYVYLLQDILSDYCFDGYNYISLDQLFDYTEEEFQLFTKKIPILREQHSKQVVDVYFYEIIDYVYSFSIANKYIGFSYDW